MRPIVGSSAYPPRHFSYIFMEPVNTYYIFNILTSSASEIVVFAIFCNTIIIYYLYYITYKTHTVNPATPFHRGLGLIF